MASSFHRSCLGAQRNNNDQKIQNKVKKKRERSCILICYCLKELIFRSAICVFSHLPPTNHVIQADAVEEVGDAAAEDRPHQERGKEVRTTMSY